VTIIFKSTKQEISAYSKWLKSSIITCLFLLLPLAINYNDRKKIKT